MLFRSNNLTIDTFQGKKIKLAEKPRDIGGAANLISSGLINGEIEGEHEHCIAAGITEQISRNIDEETGNIIVTKKSAPFLSVLTGGTIKHKNGKVINYDLRTFKNYINLDEIFKQYNQDIKKFNGCMKLIADLKIVNK